MVFVLFLSFPVLLPRLLEPFAGLLGLLAHNWGWFHDCLLDVCKFLFNIAESSVEVVAIVGLLVSLLILVFFEFLVHCYKLGNGKFDVSFCF